MSNSPPIELHCPSLKKRKLNIAICNNCITVFNKPPFTGYKVGDDVVIDTEAVASHPQSAVFGENVVSSTPEQAKECLEFNLTYSYYFYYCWLKNSKQLTPEQVLGNEQRLREEFNKVSITTQRWLEQNYLDKETSKIYLNQQLEGMLDCSEYKNQNKGLIKDVLEIYLNQSSSFLSEYNDPAYHGIEATAEVKRAYQIQKVKKQKIVEGCKELLSKLE
ncbi:3183_t:CDS:2 [Funneliformis geosporum]|uniref:14913_t:CDS:1 n=1 Tax=Funneliformis geosporum TaxID=1117311 RepID=A0A9W4SUB5_9GLOM|nr:3183_t:CDS:2 [Funneliformis geosporum]CAI2180946.1 14913_t:CDS:2 [Funneliformis geosporum]